MAEKNRAFKGIWIPKEIWLNKELSVMEKLFLVEIDSLDNEQGCFASNNYFSDFFGISKGRCSQIIKSLEQKGLVKITLERKGNQIIKRIIKVVNKLNTPVSNLNNPVSNLNTPIKNTKHPYLENAEDSNTSTNNINNNNINNNKEKGVGVVFDSFSELGFGTINGYTAEQIEEWSKTFEPKVIIKAMELASNNNKRTMSYVNGILKNWKNEGLIKLEDIEAEEKSKEVNRQSRSKNVSSGLTDEQREQYSDLGF